MRAVQITAPNTVSVLDRPEPIPAVDEVIVEPAYVGLCGTDLELLDGSMPYFAQGRAKLPLQPGHEVAGVVVASPSAAVPVGSRVVVDPVVGCGVCALCLAGRATHCVDRLELGVRGGLDGGAAERIAVPAANVHSVPDGVSLRAAVLAEPGVTALNGLRRVARLGGSALVIGAGTLGGIAAQLLAAQGLQVHVMERNTQRVELLHEWGAEPRTAPDESAYDVVIEAAGTPDAVRAALRAVAPGGSVSLLGVQGRELDQVDIDAIVLKDASVFGILNGPGLYGDMLDEIASGNVSAEALVEREFSLEDVSAAFQWLASGGGLRPKVLIRVGADHG